MKGEHHQLELREVDHAIAVSVELLDQALPVLVRNLFVFVAEDVLELPRSDLAVSV